MKRLGILILILLVIYHIPLSLYSAAINLSSITESYKQENFEDCLYLDVSDDILSEPFIHDPEFMNLNASLNYIDFNGKLKSRLKFSFLLSHPYNQLNDIAHGVLVQSILISLKFFITGCVFVSFLGDQFNLRI